MTDETRPEREKWRSIPDWPEYSVSTWGRVRSEPRVVPHPNGNLTIRGRILRPGRGPNGYLLVALARAGRAHTAKVHRLVLLAFVGPSDLEVCHLDNDPQNNRLDNLAYGTRSENADQMRRDGRAQAALGARTAQKLDWADAYLVLCALAAGETQHRIGARFGISQSTVSAIATGKAWREHQGRKTEAEPGWFFGLPPDRSPEAIAERRAALAERRAA